MTIIYTSVGNYTDYRDTLIIGAESGRNYQFLPYCDHKGIATIGIGFNIKEVDGYLRRVLTKLGFTIDDQGHVDNQYYEQIKSVLVAGVPPLAGEDMTSIAYRERSARVFQEKLQPIMDARKAVLIAAGTPEEIIRIKFELTKAEIDEVYNDIVENKEDRFDGLFNTLLPDSKERAVLLSLYYNKESLIGPGIKTAINEGNRAKAWFEIRYNSNLSMDAQMVDRRNQESEKFGLFSDTQDAAQKDKEYRDAYFMYQANKNGKIKTYAETFSSVFGAGKIQSIEQTLISPATTYFNREYSWNYGGGVYGWDRIYVSAEAQTGSGSATYTATADGEIGALVIGRKNAGNTIVGTAKDDVIHGGDSNDDISGGAGNDILIGGAGNDILRGGAGMDVLYGGAGNDVLNGGAGDDILIGGEGSDRYELSDGNDRIIDTGSGSDTDVLHLGYHYDMKVFDDGTDLVILKTGDGGGVTRVAKGMIEVLEAYDPYRDMTIRTGTDAAGLKDINGGYNAVFAAGNVLLASAESKNRYLYGGDLGEIVYGPKSSTGSAKAGDGFVVYASSASGVRFPGIAAENIVRTVSANGRTVTFRSNDDAEFKLAA